MIRDPIGFLSKLSREHGDVAALRLGPQRCVFITHPALIDRVLRDRSFERGLSTRNALASFLGHGLLSLEGSTHLRHRRLMQPAFHRERIRRYVSLMAEETYALLGGYRSGQVYDMREAMMRLTFSIVSRTLFNADTRADAAAVDVALHEVASAALLRSRLSSLLPFDLPYFPSTRAAIVRLQGMVTNIVTARRREGGDRGDLLSMLLAARDEDGSALSDEDVAAEALTILLAGHDTTANTMSWALYLLTQNPALQEALADEARGVAGDGPIGFEQLGHLTLSERIVQETLRLYPAAWLGDRVCAEPTELGGFSLPANTAVAFSVYVTQRDPRFFPDPLLFDPDRFLPERAASMTPGAYLPFGAGVHICIGNSFALMEGRLILSALAQRFRFERVDSRPVRPRPLITLGMADPFPLRLHARGSAQTHAEPGIIRSRPG
jgi:cytochrome P450